MKEIRDLQKSELFHRVISRKLIEENHKLQAEVKELRSENETLLHRVENSYHANRKFESENHELRELVREAKAYVNSWNAESPFELSSIAQWQAKAKKLLGDVK
jgi:FtsZ-binding cell division protein ZapB